MESLSDPTQTTLSIGEVSRRSGVAPSALRYYEERGLLESTRTPSGHRRYDRSVLRRVAFVVFAQRVGFTLEEIGRELRGLPRDRIPSGPDWARLSEPWIRRIDRRIAELERLRHDLGACIGCGCLSVDACRLVNPGDEAAAFGPGPARWRG